jgi:UDP-N-acetylglucosamine/UDP-N-acetylgalactosamine diphosphorylase
MQIDELRALAQAKPTPLKGRLAANATKPQAQPAQSARLILAGGQASRLGKGPKALLEVGGRRLIEYLIDPAIETYVMTAPDMLEIIQGAAPHAHCFVQKELPTLDQTNLEVCGSAPAGNGDALAALARSGLLEKIEADRLTVLPIDNPLGCKAELLLSRSRCDIAIGAVKGKPGEKAGAILEIDGCHRVAEYIYGNRSALYINTGIYSISLDFARRMWDRELPLHVVSRNEGGNAGAQMIYKFEHFLFDIFPFAQSTELVELERSSCFAPIKIPADLDRFATLAESAIKDI